MRKETNMLVSYDVLASQAGQILLVPVTTGRLSKQRNDITKADDVRSGYRRTTRHLFSEKRPVPARRSWVADRNKHEEEHKTANPIIVKVNNNLRTIPYNTMTRDLILPRNRYFLYNAETLL
jgi:hypothetical protein